MEEARLKLMNAFEHADKKLTEDEKQALAADLEEKLEDWK